jgi:hypothetical protein
VGMVGKRTSEDRVPLLAIIHHGRGKQFQCPRRVRM